MKVRKSFVTNSSSSSFLMGKEGDGMTKDIIFRMICGLYKDYYAIKDQIMARLDEFPGMYWDENYQGFEVPESEDVEDSRIFWKSSERLEETFGIFSWSHFGYDVGWWDLETYQEYLDYWKPKHENREFEPFEIIDYGANEKDHCLCGEDIFHWYVRCNGMAVTEIEKCENCYMDFGDEKCNEYRQGVREGRITKKNRLEAFLGRFCIDSWEGDIPYWVAQKLCEISRFACTHMG